MAQHAVLRVLCSAPNATGAHQNVGAMFLHNVVAMTKKHRGAMFRHNVFAMTKKHSVNEFEHSDMSAVCSTRPESWMESSLEWVTTEDLANSGPGNKLLDS